jgi:hypothetical protein
MRHTCVLSLFCAAALLPRAASADDKESDAERVEWGFGAQARQLHAHVWTQKRFVEDTPGEAHENGVAIEFTRRTKQIEFVFALGYDELDGRDGYYLELGEDPTMPGTVSYLDFQELSAITVEGTIVGHAQIHKILSLRYGAGLGLGIIRGQVLQTDMICSSDRIQEDCVDDPNGEKQETPADIPPVVPVVNILVGVELRPVKPIAVHLDVGIHTVPFIGAGATLYLW